MGDAARDEIGEYSIATRFGKGKRIYHDKKWRRPSTLKQVLHQIEATRLGNGWDAGEFAINCELIGLGAKLLADFAPNELDIILADFAARRMILYED